MKQIDLDFIFSEIPEEKFKKLTPDQMFEFLKLEQQFRIRLQKENTQLKKELLKPIEQLQFLTDEKYIGLKNRFFGSSTERREYEAKQNSSQTPKVKSEKSKKILLPSERYPNAPVHVTDIEFKKLPSCTCCGQQMKDSGMVEESEYLHIIPKQYRVVVQRRHKYSCGQCYGSMTTAPAPLRIKEGSAYSDAMMIDVAMSKYCDLVPVERYAAIAAREGFKGLPSNSLIESTHYVADYIGGAYQCIKDEVKKAQWLHADETPHKMLEGDSKNNWYLWSFSTPKACYFEYHNTRSGLVASDLLKESSCEFLLSDVFSGYSKAVSDSNEFRDRNNLPKLKNVYCNAHARRKFIEAEINFSEQAGYFIKAYQQIYLLEKQAKELPLLERHKYRDQMRPIFEQMRQRGYEYLKGVSDKSSLARAITYFIRNYEGLTLCLNHSFLPLDNNAAERALRSPVVGRKTWYGTHSKLGAKTAAVLFSLVESCKLNQVNPREYLKRLVLDLHAGKPAYSPASFAAILDAETKPTVSTLQ